MTPLILNNWPLTFYYEIPSVPYSESFQYDLSIHCVSEMLKNYLNSFKPSILFVGHRKQNNPRCEAAKRGIPSGAILFTWKKFIEKVNKNLKSHLKPLK